MSRKIPLRLSLLWARIGGALLVSPALLGMKYAVPLPGSRSQSADAVAIPSVMGPLLVIPRPKNLTVPEGAAPFPITAGTRIVVPDRATAEELRGAAALRREIK